jgi:hypothetical protein
MDSRYSSYGAGGEYRWRVGGEHTWRVCGEQVAVEVEVRVQGRWSGGGVEG